MSQVIYIYIQNSLQQKDPTNGACGYIYRIKMTLGLPLTLGLPHDLSSTRSLLEFYMNFRICRELCANVVHNVTKMAINLIDSSTDGKF